jgi:hypothetical protein
MLSTPPIRPQEIDKRIAEMLGPETPSPQQIIGAYRTLYGQLWVSWRLAVAEVEECEARLSRSPEPQAGEGS